MGPSLCCAGWGCFRVCFQEPPSPAPLYSPPPQQAACKVSGGVTPKRSRGGGTPALEVAASFAGGPHCAPPIHNPPTHSRSPLAACIPLFFLEPPPPIGASAGSRAARSLAAGGAAAAAPVAQPVSALSARFQQSRGFLADAADARPRRATACVAANIPSGQNTNFSGQVLLTYLNLYPQPNNY